MSRTFSTLTTALDGPALWVTLNNPARKNAIGPTMVNELLYALGDAAAESVVRAVVLTGAGDAFCAGGDFATMTLGTAVESLPPKGDYADLLLAMTRFPKPILARVNGHAMGGGLGLVAASHFAIAARGAQLATPEINVGLFPMMIMAVLARVVPRRRLMDMMLLGERLDADQAAAMGLVTRAVDPEVLDQAIASLVASIASKSPLTVRLGLEAFAEQADLDLEPALSLLRERLGQCLATDDAREGLTAFLEKRRPQWTGR
jgi:enoyl-CoA hydratase/carnithine racemase